jgi:hypothetical protein
LPLARQLAGDDAPFQDILRWKAVIVRAERGGEPSPQYASQVGDFFGLAVVVPVRSKTTRTELQLRLGEVEAYLDELGPQLARLADRVASLERRDPPKRRQGGGAGGQE